VLSLVRAADAVDVVCRVRPAELSVPLLGDGSPFSQREPLRGVESRAGATVEAAAGDVDDHRFLLMELPTAMIL